MAGITGIGSGMDIDSMVTAIVGAEQAPKQNQLAKLEKTTTTQLTALGQLKGAISTFQSALVALNSPSQFLARTATSSDTKVFTATASQSAPSGTYQLEVSQLASPSKVALAAVPSGDDKKLSSGTLSIKVGSEQILELKIDSTNNTLSGIRDAINKAAAGVSANIVTDDHGSRLVLTGAKQGDGNDISVDVTGAGDEDGTTSLSKLAFSGNAVAPDSADYPDGVDDADYQAALKAYDEAGKVLTTAQSAKLKIDGLSVTSDSNTIGNRISGVSIDLKATGSSTLTVAQDQAGVKGNVQKFVDAYNVLINYINSATKVTVVNETDAPVTGDLVGDSSVRSLVNTIRNELVSVQGDGVIRGLADLGVTTQQDGTLKVDSDKLGKAVTSNFDGIAGYFTGDDGLATRLGNKLKAYTDGDGILELRTDALQATLDKVDKQKEDLTARMTALSERLYKQFNAMDALVGQLKNTSDSLTSLFDNMPGFVSQKD
ncbi:B-type flagellar hook-associated protein 2 [compost metagenome]|uniref:Flagellar hook-associated protein 2 n=1 Tax=Pseudomonas jinjuensis TaxID=198616 RepID=A0A1H0I3D0_9PSED|nr:flagellar filament capping protein FliD [Pseudomonas jinjuensis]SDO25967.1 flagellar hook-associated protein 2 [Pseudomonas jinjuensis]